MIKALFFSYVVSDLTPLQISIERSYKASAKWSGWAENLRVAIFVCGLGSVFITNIPYAYPITIAMLSLIVELMIWRADALYQDGEKMKTTHELADGFGLYPPNTSLAEKASNTAGSSNIPQGLIYHTNTPPSPLRALHNLHESSFFSMHLAKASAVKPLVTASSIIGIGILLMVYSPSLIDNFSDMRKTILVATSLILGAFSLNLIKRGLALLSFAKTSKDIAHRSETLLAEKDLTEYQVFPLLQEYQAERLLTPPINSKIWEKKKDYLNTAYEKNFPNKTQ